MTQKVMPISGFPEFLPHEQIQFEKTIAMIKGVYESYGFVPIETPAIERESTLLSKGGDDKEVYGIRRLAAQGCENGDKALGLRFDLTIPLARYVSQHQSDLIFPFKRFQVQPVWRGERTQGGRYRQFYQADIDVIGNGILSLQYDAEVISIASIILNKLEIGDFVIRVNNRKLLFGYLSSFGFDEAETVKAIRILDRIDKVRMSTTVSDLVDLGLTESEVESMLAFMTAKRSNADWISFLSDMDLNESFNEGVSELIEVVEAVSMQGQSSSIKIDPLVARGMDYYTGTIYETILTGFEQLGSICSGGRYENLTENFTKKALPGVGISIGLSRLFYHLLDKQKVDISRKTTAHVLVTVQNPDLIGKYLNIANALRDAGVSTEIFHETHKLKKRLKEIERDDSLTPEYKQSYTKRAQVDSLAKQIKYAKNKGFVMVVIADDSQLNNFSYCIENLVALTYKELLEPTREVMSRENNPGLDPSMEGVINGRNTAPRVVPAGTKRHVAFNQIACTIEDIINNPNITY